MDFNWFMFIFCGVIPTGAIFGMTIAMVADHLKRKKRLRKNHRHISEWWELTVE